VDDDEVNQEVVQGIFKPEGLNITIAMNGQQCLKEIEKNSFHIVLLDSMMPGMSGLEVCKHLRKRFTPLQLPIIMLTCRTAAEEAGEAIDAGCNDYVRKPFTRVELVARMHVQLAMMQERQVLDMQMKHLAVKASPGLQRTPTPLPTPTASLGALPALPPPSIGASSLGAIQVLPPMPLALRQDALAFSGSVDANSIQSIFMQRSEVLHRDIADLRGALRDQERATRSARGELASCRAKLAAMHTEAEEVWQRLTESEQAVIDIKYGKLRDVDHEWLVKLGHA